MSDQAIVLTESERMLVAFALGAAFMHKRWPPSESAEQDLESILRKLDNVLDPEMPGE